MSRRSFQFYAPSYFKLSTHFRNWFSIAMRHHRREECAEGVFWNGRRFGMPANRGGLADTIVEMWGAEVYTSGGFYRPKAQDVVLDVGANVGAFSLWLTQRSPETAIVAVEPSDESADRLDDNLKGWPNRVTVHRAAVGGRSGSGVLVEHGDRSLDTQVAVDDRDEAVERPSGPSVRVMTLREILDLTGRERIDFLKMDVEGAERAVFETASCAELERIERISLDTDDNLRPGTLALIKSRIAETHTIVSVDRSDGYGILRAVRHHTLSD